MLMKAYGGVDVSKFLPLLLHSILAFTVMICILIFVSDVCLPNFVLIISLILLHLCVLFNDVVSTAG